MTPKGNGKEKRGLGWEPGSSNVYCLKSPWSTVPAVYGWYVLAKNVLFDKACSYGQLV